MNIILHEIDSIAVGIDKKDGYLNATKLCTAYNNRKGTNKIPRDWLSTKRAKEYIAYVASVTLEPLIIVKQGGGINEQGTWIHPGLGTAFSEWLEKPSNKKSEFLYVIGDKTHQVCKIGITGDPDKRLRMIQISYPWDLDFWHCVRITDARVVERQLHIKLADFRLNGEWFDSQVMKLVNWEDYI